MNALEGLQGPLLRRRMPVRRCCTPPAGPGKARHVTPRDLEATDRESAAEAHRDSNLRYRELFAANPQPMWFFDTATLSFLEVNDAAVDHYGYSRDEFLAMTIADIRPPEDVPRLRATVGRVSEHAIDEAGVWRHRKKDGSIIFVEITSHVVPYEGRQAEFVLAHDVTARLKAEAAVLESEERLRLFIRHAPVAVAMFDREMRHVATSRRWLDDYGLGERDLAGLSLYEVFPELEERWTAVHRRALAGEIVRADEDRFERANGKVEWLQWEVRPWTSADGAIAGVLVYREDITARKKAEDELRRQGQLLRDAGNTAHVGGWEFDPVTLEGSWSEETALIHDVDPSAPIDVLKGLDFYTPEARAKIQAAMREAIRRGTPYDLELEIVTAKGRRKWVRTIAHPVVENGRVVRVAGSLQDITDRKAAETAIVHLNAELKDALDWQRQIFEGSRDAVFLSDENSRFVAVNRAAQDLTGYSRGELLAMRIPDLHEEPDLAAFHRFHDRIFAGERILSEAPIRRRDATKVEVEFNNSLVVVGGRRLMHTSARDVTERRKAAEALEASEARYRALFENAAEGISVVDPETGRTLFHNPALREMFGYSEEEFRGIAVDRLHPPGALDAVRRDIRGTIQGTRGELDIVPCVRRDGTTFEADIRGSTTVIDGRRVAIGFFTDVTDRLRSMRRLSLQAAVGRILAEAESLAVVVPAILRAVGESEGMAFGAWWEPDPGTPALRCAHTWSADPVRTAELDAASRAVPVQPGECVAGKVWTSRQAVHVPSIAGTTGCPRAPIALRAGLGSAVGFPVLLRGEPVGAVEFFGREIPALDPALTASVETLGSQIALYLERKRAQEETARYIAGNPVVLYALRVTGAELEITWFSRNIEALTGYPPAEIEKDAMAWWIAGIHPEDRPRVREAGRTALEKGVASLEFRFRRRDGTFFWVRDEKRLLRDGAGRPSEVVGSWTDVTDRVRLEEQLRQSQKMEAVGQLAGGVAHDFNNLLTVISGNCDLLLTDVSPDDPSRGPLTDIRAAGERAATLTRQLLAFSRKQVLAPKLVNVNDVIASLERMLRRLIGEDVDVVTDLAAAQSWAKVDPGQLEQVLVNLAVNARDAMPRGGRITFRTRNLAAEGAVDLDEIPGRRPLPKVAISVSDTGTGIAPEVKARLFEPFFTTKAVGKGTGLGLATVYGIVKQSGGDIWVESEPASGSTFTVVLPSQPAPSRDESGATLHALPRGVETILVVEDEDAVRRIVRITLESTGYTVLEARSGAEALEITARHAGRIDLVLTDVVMPEMSGRELAERLAKDQPGIPILFVSGYTDDAVVRHGLVESAVAFLQKPFSPIALAHRVRDVLDGTALGPERGAVGSGT
jgi:two-component system, cell cycle sensor histidine kinase and response regulator CckA